MESRGFFLQLEGSLGQVDGLVWGSVSLDCVLSHLFPRVGFFGFFGGPKNMTFPEFGVSAHFGGG